MLIPKKKKTKKNPKGDKLSLKEEGFVADFAKTKNATEAAARNYKTKNRNSAGVIGNQNLKKVKIQKALEEYFPDDFLGQTHLELFNAGKLDHMTFPMERKKSVILDDDHGGDLLYRECLRLISNEEQITTALLQRKLKIGYSRATNMRDKMIGTDVISDDGTVNTQRLIQELSTPIVQPQPATEYEHANMSDKDITDLLESVGCKVKKIVPMYGERHVYFWAPDALARDRALDKAYKIRGKYAAEKRELTGPGGEPLFSEEHRKKSQHALREILD